MNQTLKNEDKLASIVLATYNGEKFLREQLDSLVNQTYKNFEVIAQDDCSTDATVEILKSYINKINIKIFINSNNLGFGKNFETAIQRANGDFIALCDQDDIWAANKLELLIASLGNYSLVYSDSMLINDAGESTGTLFSSRLKYNFISSQTVSNFIFFNCVSAHSMLFKKELLESLFPFPNNLYFDAWITVCAANNKGIYFIQEPLVGYRQHSTNTLSNKQKVKIPIIEKITNQTSKRLIDYENLLSRINTFLKIPNLKLTEKLLLTKLHYLLTTLKEERFSMHLFLFLFTHRKLLFAISKKNKLRLCLKQAIGLKMNILKTPT